MRHSDESGLELVKPLEAQLCRAFVRLLMGEAPSESERATLAEGPALTAGELEMGPVRAVHCLHFIPDADVDDHGQPCSLWDSALVVDAEVPGRGGLALRCSNTALRRLLRCGARASSPNLY